MVVDGDPRVALADLLADEAVEETGEYHHRQTEPARPGDGQGDAHVAFAFAAHRAVVDVDTELGLVQVVESPPPRTSAGAQPAGRRGQIEGGIAQGLGLALMEEIQVVDGKVRNPSFTDYLIPTILDMPPVRLDVLELGHPDAPFGCAASASRRPSPRPRPRRRRPRRHRPTPHPRAGPPRAHRRGPGPGRRP